MGRLDQQKAEQALPYAPDFMREVLEQSSEEPKIDPGEATERVMIELSQSDAWKVVKKYINEKRRRLEEMTRASIREDAFNLQNTGFRYMIFDQVDSFAQDIIDRVESYQKAKKVQNDTPTVE